MLPPRGVSTAHRNWTNFGRAGELPNIITHAKFEINWYKIVTLAKGWSFHVLALLRRTQLTRLSPAGRAACDGVAERAPLCMQQDGEHMRYICSWVWWYDWAEPSNRVTALCTYSVWGLSIRWHGRHATRDWAETQLYAHENRIIARGSWQELRSVFTIP